MGHTLVSNWFPVHFTHILYSALHIAGEGRKMKVMKCRVTQTVTWVHGQASAGLETARDQTGSGKILCWSYTCCCTTRQLQMAQEPKCPSLLVSMQKAVLELNSSWTWIETNNFFGLDWGFGEKRVIEMLWYGFWDSLRLWSGIWSRTSGFSSRLSLGRSGPTEVLLRSSRSDASNVSPPAGPWVQCSLPRLLYIVIFIF